MGLVDEHMIDAKLVKYQAIVLLILSGKLFQPLYAGSGVMWFRSPSVYPVMP
jgi:hypothetical protein